ncbi:MAG: CPBP family intramembrane metalloprotease [Verrucomicrobiota bacterium]|nr:CPBP family intramembrane metalloprotease [Verrucomicrobiota bacterium]
MGGISSAFGSLIWALFFVAGTYIYVALFRQVTNRPPSEPGERRFAWPEAILAAFLIALFSLSLLAHLGTRSVISNIQNKDLLENAILAIGLIVLISLVLKLRGFSVTELAGFNRFGVSRVLATGVVLLITAYPLIFAAEWLSATFAGTGNERQGIIELFSGSESMTQRIMIIVLGVVIAPVAEEFIFRFFLYGVMRRYAGRTLGIIVSSLLFAAVHAHLPSLAPLFVFAVCLALAYDWSGSILVSMTMHSLFNALTFFALAFPDSPPQ